MLLLACCNGERTDQDTHSALGTFPLILGLGKCMIISVVGYSIAHKIAVALWKSKGDSP